MSEIKALKELRKLKGEVVDYRWGVEFDRAIDALEAEVAERYVTLPCDMDGEVLNIGDSVVEASDPSPCKVMSLIWYGDCWDVNSCGMNPNLLRHVRPRTLEDVLRDYWCDEESIKKCADEIRAMLVEEDHD